jgi:hypothetical protein
MIKFYFAYNGTKEKNNAKNYINNLKITLPAL